jgi:DNA repair exonuclease SbcCD ATPase subunit
MDRTQALKDQAKDLQARYGYLAMQMKTLTKEMEAVEILLAAGEREYKDLQDTQARTAAPSVASSDATPGTL